MALSSLPLCPRPATPNNASVVDDSHRHIRRCLFNDHPHPSLHPPTSDPANIIDPAELLSLTSKSDSSAQQSWVKIRAESTWTTRTNSGCAHGGEHREINQDEPRAHEVQLQAVSVVTTVVAMIEDEAETIILDATRLQRKTTTLKKITVDHLRVTSGFHPDARRENLPFLHRAVSVRVLQDHERLASTWPKPLIPAVRLNVSPDQAKLREKRFSRLSLAVRLIIRGGIRPLCQHLSMYQDKALGLR